VLSSVVLRKRKCDVARQRLLRELYGMTLVCHIHLTCIGENDGRHIANAYHVFTAISRQEKAPCTLNTLGEKPNPGGLRWLSQERSRTTGREDYDGET